jgi:hypothetical protein
LFSGAKKHLFGEPNIKFMLRIGNDLLNSRFGKIKRKSLQRNISFESLNIEPGFYHGLNQ